MTTWENIADLGGMSAALEVLSQTSEQNYQDFFQGWAQSWVIKGNKQLITSVVQAGPHAANKIRVNRTIANFAEFYKAFGITEKDGMYIAPEDRVSVW